MKEFDNIRKSGELAPRRRRFLAERREGGTTSDALSFPTLVEEDDIPILTDVVQEEPPEEKPEPKKYSFSPASELPPITISPGPVPLDFPDITKEHPEELVAQLARAINKQLTYELPSLVEASLLNISDELRTGIMATMDAALREFMAGRK